MTGVCMIGMPQIAEIDAMPSMRRIAYKRGYKYQLVADYVVRTPVRPGRDILHDWFVLTAAGVLYVMKGYAWDGASGPTWDTDSSMRPSLIHDCFCQMMKERQIGYSTWSATVHRQFYEHCIEDGMWKLRASLWHAGVVVGRGGDPDVPDDNPVVFSPEGA
jgi:hypothetical protein